MAAGVAAHEPGVTAGRPPANSSSDFVRLTCLEQNGRKAECAGHTAATEPFPLRREPLGLILKVFVRTSHFASRMRLKGGYSHPVTAPFIDFTGDLSPDNKRFLPCKIKAQNNPRFPGMRGIFVSGASAPSDSLRAY
jgi:hypothetical protein